MTDLSRNPGDTLRSASGGSPRAFARFAAALLSTSVRASLADRATFILRVAFMALNNGIFFTFWIVLLSRVPRIRGYTLGDVAVLYGTVAMAHGLSVFVAGGMAQLARVIHDGELDSLLAQPKPTLVYALGLKSQPSGLGDIVSGIVMIALSGRAGLSTIPVAMLVVIAAAVVLVSTSVLLHSSAFWLGRTQTASWQLYEGTLMFSLYPDTLFGGPMRLILFTILPAGFVGYVPAQLIRAPSWSMAGALLGAVVLYAGTAAWVFNRGLRSYCGGSRFVSFG